MSYRAYKYRIYPNNEQQNFLNKNFGAVRFVWNHLVANFNRPKDFVGPCLPSSEKNIKDCYVFLKDVISYALQQKRIDFEETKKQFFSKTRKTKLGRMKFKSKGKSNDSFRIPFASLTPNAIDLVNGSIKFPKMTPMKMVVDRTFEGIPKSVTISRNRCGQYFVSILVEEEIKPKQLSNRSVGIDLGFIDLCTLSNGIKVGNPRWFRETQTKLAKQQRHLSRKVKGSNRYQKQKLKVARTYQKITNQRDYVLHNISTWLVNNFDVICMEDLNIEGMKKLFGKSASDASLGKLVSMIKYKCEWYGKTFHQVSRWYPSSKTCNHCGHKNENLSLDVREWKCGSCGNVNDRDLNASKNLLDQGLKDLFNFTSDELADYKHREEISPKVVTPKGIFVEMFNV